VEISGIEPEPHPCEGRVIPLYYIPKLEFQKLGKKLIHLAGRTVKKIQTKKNCKKNGVHDNHKNQIFSDEAVFFGVFIVYAIHSLILALDS
jgi:hypothetical protein